MDDQEAQKKELTKELAAGLKQRIRPAVDGSPDSNEKSPPGVVDLPPPPKKRLSTSKSSDTPKPLPFLPDIANFKQAKLKSSKKVRDSKTEKVRNSAPNISNNRLMNELREKIKSLPPKLTNNEQDGEIQDSEWYDDQDKTSSKSSFDIEVSDNETNDKDSDTMKNSNDLYEILIEQTENTKFKFKEDTNLNELEGIIIGMHKQNPNILKTGTNGHTPFLLTVRCNCLRLVKYIYKLDTDVINVKITEGENEFNILFWMITGIYNFKKEIIDFIIEKIDINEKFEEHNALSHATFQIKPYFCEKLINQGIEIERDNITQSILYAIDKYSEYLLLPEGEIDKLIKNESLDLNLVKFKITNTNKKLYKVFNIIFTHCNFTQPITIKNQISNLFFTCLICGDIYFINKIIKIKDINDLSNMINSKLGKSSIIRIIIYNEKYNVIIERIINLQLYKNLTKNNINEFAYELFEFRFKDPDNKYFKKFLNILIKENKIDKNYKIDVFNLFNIKKKENIEKKKYDFNYDIYYDIILKLF